jgi:predicted kinase
MAGDHEVLSMPDVANRPATLHFLCGKIASGKTTLARRIATECDGLLISEDVWLERMYAGTHFTLADYIRRSTRLRAALAPHVTDLLRRGVSVVFDFAGNMPRDRQWVRSVFEHANAAHLLHSINASDALCKARLRARNAGAPEGSQLTTDEEFDAISAYFVAPSPDEGFLVRQYDADEEQRASERTESR